MKKILLAVLMATVFSLQAVSAKDVNVDLRNKMPVIKSGIITPTKISVSAKTGDTLKFKVQGWTDKDKSEPFFRSDCIRQCDLKAYAANGYGEFRGEELSKDSCLEVNSKTKLSGGVIEFSVKALKPGHEILNFFSQGGVPLELPDIIVNVAVQ